MTKIISNNNIYKMANAVKNHVEKGNTGIPSSLTYDNVSYSWQEIMYILPYAVNNLSKDCEVPSITKPSDAWLGNTITEQVEKSDYSKQATNIVKFVKNNSGKIPNYVTTIKSKKKVNANLYTFCFAKILVYYQNHSKTLPNICLYRSSDVKQAKTVSKYGHATKKGCDNMGQNNGYYCGCHSLQEVFRNLTGRVVPQKTIAGWALTTTAGTSHAGLDTAVAKFNKTYNENLKVTWKNFSDLGWSGIDKIVKSNNQDCVIHNLYRNKYGHYEVVNNVSSNITVQNSLGDTCSSGCYCGYIEYRSQATFRSYINGISQKSVMVITNAK